VDPMPSPLQPDLSQITSPTAHGTPPTMAVQPSNTMMHMFTSTCAQGLNASKAEVL
jgi:hypothetical protein